MIEFLYELKRRADSASLKRFALIVGPILIITAFIDLMIGRVFWFYLGAGVPSAGVIGFIDVWRNNPPVTNSTER